MKIRLHEELKLNPFLFAIVTDRLLNKIGKKSPLSMTFASDIVFGWKEKGGGKSLATPEIRRQILNNWDQLHEQ